MTSYKWILFPAVSVLTMAVATGCKGASYSAAQAERLQAESEVFIVRAHQCLGRAAELQLKGQIEQALANLTEAADTSVRFLEAQLEDHQSFESRAAMQRLFDLGDLLQACCMVLTRRAEINYARGTGESPLAVDFRQLFADLRSVVSWHDTCDWVQNKLSGVDQHLSSRARTLEEDLDLYAFRCHYMLAGLGVLGRHEELATKHSNEAAGIARRRPDLGLRAPNFQG